MLNMAVLQHKEEFAFLALLLVVGQCGILVHGFEHGAFYQQVATDMQDKEVEMSQFQEKVVLIVNVASECGYTGSNYEWLNKLNKMYEKHGLTILLFPCNQFGRQEPGTDMEILNFIGRQQVHKAHVFKKVAVTGTEAHPLFDFLHDRTGHEPKWNFAKYLIDRSGENVRFYSTQEELEEVEDMIRHELQMGKPHLEL